MRNDNRFLPVPFNQRGSDIVPGTSPDKLRELIAEYRYYLAESATLEGAAYGYDSLAALHKLAKQFKAALDIQNAAAAGKLEAEARLGKFLKLAPRKPGQRTDLGNDPSEYAAVCQELSITRRTANRWSAVHHYLNHHPDDFVRITEFSTANGYEMSERAALDRLGVLLDWPEFSEPVRQLDALMPIRRVEVAHKLNKMALSNSQTFEEIARSLHLQPGEEADSIPVWELTLDQLNEDLGRRSKEKAAAAMDAKVVTTVEFPLPDGFALYPTLPKQDPDIQVSLIFVHDTGFNMDEKFCTELASHIDIGNIFIRTWRTRFGQWEHLMKSTMFYIIGELTLEVPRNAHHFTTTGVPVLWYSNEGPEALPSLRGVISTEGEWPNVALGRVILPALVARGNTVLTYTDNYGGFLMSALQQEIKGIGVIPLDHDRARVAERLSTPTD